MNVIDILCWRVLESEVGDTAFAFFFHSKFDTQMTFLTTSLMNASKELLDYLEIDSGKSIIRLNLPKLRIIFLWEARCVEE
jgi:hypothetical protein